MTKLGEWILYKFPILHMHSHIIWCRSSKIGNITDHEERKITVSWLLCCIQVSGMITLSSSAYSSEWLLFWIAVLLDSGSRYEVLYPSGVSHFLEKLAFKVSCYDFLSLIPGNRLCSYWNDRQSVILMHKQMCVVLLHDAMGSVVPYCNSVCLSLSLSVYLSLCLITFVPHESKESRTPYSCS